MTTPTAWLPGTPVDPAHLRRLAIVPQPVPDEAFHSWFFRIADAHHARADFMAPHLGLPPFTVFRYTVGLDPGAPLAWRHEQAVDNVFRTTGLRPSRMRAMLLPLYGMGWTPCSWNGTDERHAWFWRIDNPAICPRCLAEPEAAWRITWHLLPTVACPIHHIYLHGWCPSCRTPISVGNISRYRRLCAGPYFDASSYRDLQVCPIRGARRCGQPLAQLACRPLKDQRLLRLQRDLMAKLTSTQEPATRQNATDNITEITPEIIAFWDLYELLFRLAIFLGTPEMLPATTDTWLWWTFHEFCHLRDTLALTAGHCAEGYYRELVNRQPGPALTAAAMLIIDELAQGDDLRTALARFMDQRRFDPWAEVLWGMFRRWQPGLAPYDKRISAHLGRPGPDYDMERPHPPASLDGIDLLPWALLLTGEGLANPLGA